MKKVEIFFEKIVKYQNEKFNLKFSIYLKNQFSLKINQLWVFNPKFYHFSKSPFSSIDLTKNIIPKSLI